ncbi:MAG: hypothetical protein LBN94_01940 [Puniceicoccales bacterium]|jgi:hypothetical protein|nr:hypothetical protein [Puniceicoccales bacterium]
MKNTIKIKIVSLIVASLCGSAFANNAWEENSCESPNYPGLGEQVIHDYYMDPSNNYGYYGSSCALARSNIRLFVDASSRKFAFLDSAGRPMYFILCESLKKFLSKDCCCHVLPNKLFNRIVDKKSCDKMKNFYAQNLGDIVHRAELEKDNFKKEYDSGLNVIVLENITKPECRYIVDAKNARVFSCLPGQLNKVCSMKLPEAIFQKIVKDCNYISINGEKHIVFDFLGLAAKARTITGQKLSVAKDYAIVAKDVVLDWAAKAAIVLGPRLSAAKAWFQPKMHVAWTYSKWGMADVLKKTAEICSILSDKLRPKDQIVAVENITIGQN